MASMLGEIWMCATRAGSDSSNVAAISLAISLMFTGRNCIGI